MATVGILLGDAVVGTRLAEQLSSMTRGIGEAMNAQLAEQAASISRGVAEGAVGTRFVEQFASMTRGIGEGAVGTRFVEQFASMTSGVAEGAVGTRFVEQFASMTRGLGEAFSANLAAQLSPAFRSQELVTSRALEQLVPVFRAASEIAAQRLADQPAAPLTPAAGVDRALSEPLQPGRPLDLRLEELLSKMSILELVAVCEAIFFAITITLYVGAFLAGSDEEFNPTLKVIQSYDALFSNIHAAALGLIVGLLIRRRS